MRVTIIEERWVGDVAERVTTVRETPDTIVSPVLGTFIDSNRPIPKPKVVPLANTYQPRMTLSGRRFEDVPLWAFARSFFATKYPNCGIAWCNSMADEFFQKWMVYTHPSEK